MKSSNLKWFCHTLCLEFWSGFFQERASSKMSRCRVFLINITIFKLVLTDANGPISHRCVRGVLQMHRNSFFHFYPPKNHLFISLGKGKTRLTAVLYRERRFISWVIRLSFWPWIPFLMLPIYMMQNKLPNLPGSLLLYLKNNIRGTRHSELKELPS